MAVTFFSLRIREEYLFQNNFRVQICRMLKFDVYEQSGLDDILITFVLALERIEIKSPTLLNICS